MRVTITVESNHRGNVEVSVETLNEPEEAGGGNEALSSLLHDALSTVKGAYGVN